MICIALYQCTLVDVVALNVVNLNWKWSLHVLDWIIGKLLKADVPPVQFLFYIGSQKIIGKESESEREFLLDLWILASWRYTEICILLLRLFIRQMHVSSAQHEKIRWSNTPEHVVARHIVLLMYYLFFDVWHTSRPKSDTTEWICWTQLGRDMLIVVLHTFVCTFQRFKKGYHFLFDLLNVNVSGKNRHFSMSTNTGLFKGYWSLWDLLLQVFLQ